MWNVFSCLTESIWTWEKNTLWVVAIPQYISCISQSMTSTISLCFGTQTKDTWTVPCLFLLGGCILKSHDFKRKSVQDWPGKWLLRTTSVLMASFAKSSFCFWAQQVNNWKNACCRRQPTILQHISCAWYAVPTSLPNIPALKWIKCNTRSIKNVNALYQQ